MQLGTTSAPFPAGLAPRRQALEKKIKNREGDEAEGGESVNGTEKRRKGDTGDILLRIDLEPHAHILGLILYILVYPRGTEPILHPPILRPLDTGMAVPILDLQMHGLILLVIRAGATHAGQNVETDLVIRLGVFELWALVGGLGGGVVGAGVVEGPGGAAAEEEGFETGIRDAAVEAERGVEGGPHVAHLVQFFPDGRFAQGGFVVVEEDGAAVFVGGEGGVGGLGGEHAGAHGRVGAFDLGHVQEAGGVADEGAAGEGAFGDGLEAAFVEGAGAVGDAFAAFEHGGVERVMFHLLELAVGGEPGIGVVEADDEADGHEVVAEVVHPAAAVGVFGEGVAHRVGDFAFAEVFGRDLPDFFEAESVRLGLAIAAEVVLFDDLFRKTAVTTFAEESYARVEFHASFERVLGFSIPPNAHVVRCHTHY